MLKEEGLGERGHLESQGGVVCWHSECSLAKQEQLAGAEHRLVQLGVGNHSQEEEEISQPRQLDVAPSADSFCAALEKISFGRKTCQSFNLTECVCHIFLDIYDCSLRFFKKAPKILRLKVDLSESSLRCPNATKMYLS